MACSFHKSNLLVLCISYGLWLSVAQNDGNLKLPLKAVNLGAWLVTEGWMIPNLFDRIVNNDLLDGTQVQLFSTKLQKYICPENGGGTIVVANRSSASGWETFIVGLSASKQILWRVSDTTFNFRVFDKQFVGVENQGQGNNVVAVSTAPGNSETFKIVRKEGDPNTVRIQTPNGQFLQANSEELVTADYQRDGWEDSNPSVFKMTILTDKTLRGEYQITNGYGPEKAAQVMQDHWNTYITEEDFKFLSSHGVNAVRIPVGWWIAQDPHPPKPFVGGSLAALDNAFEWAQTHGLKVIVDLHAVQGSQNGNDHSGARDGYIEWGDSYIPDTVKVIDFLARRYSNRPSLASIELINEPTASASYSLDTLINYYQAGYNAVRKYTSAAYVIMSNRLGPHDTRELLSFAGSLNRVVIDVHYYNLYTDEFKNKNVQQQIDYINNQRSNDLNALTTSNGPLTLVGEWVAEWDVEHASVQDYQRFAQAQIDVYSHASFGWAYWAYKCEYGHWSLKWMIENNIISLTSNNN